MIGGAVLVAPDVPQGRAVAASPLASLALIIALGLAGCGQAPLTNAPPRIDRICCFGDSLVVGKGATPETSYPTVLGELLAIQVDTFAKSGDTTADGLAKCGVFKPDQFGVIVVTLGGNDILQRVPFTETATNLSAIFDKLQATGAVVAFTEVLSPLTVSRGRKYKALCREAGVLYIPNILKGILTNPELKADEVHPNADGYRLVANRVAAALREAQLVKTQVAQQ